MIYRDLSGIVWVGNIMTLQKREGIESWRCWKPQFSTFLGGLGFERWASFFGREDLLVERSWCWFFLSFI